MCLSIASPNSPQAVPTRDSQRVGRVGHGCLDESERLAVHADQREDVAADLCAPIS